MPKVYSNYYLNRCKDIIYTAISEHYPDYNMAMWAKVYLEGDYEIKCPPLNTLHQLFMESLEKYCHDKNISEEQLSHDYLQNNPKKNLLASGRQK